MLGRAAGAKKERHLTAFFFEKGGKTSLHLLFSVDERVRGSIWREGLPMCVQNLSVYFDATKGAEISCKTLFRRRNFFETFDER